MAFTHGKDSRILANGRAVSTTVSSWTVSIQRALSEVTVVADAGARYVPGLATGVMTLGGPQDSVGQNLHTQVASAVGVDNSLILTALPYGTALGQHTLTAMGDVSEWSIDSTVADSVRYQMTTVADEMVDMGFVVHPLQAETATGNGTSIDRGAASANGGAAVLHVTGYATLTNAAIKIQHSTDNSAWSDLVTFTTVTTIGAERKLLLPGTTINRYVRAVTTVTGSGSVTFLVALEPR